jgi:hypothetical protein
MIAKTRHQFSQIVGELHEFRFVQAALNRFAYEALWPDDASNENEKGRPTHGPAALLKC